MGGRCDSHRYGHLRSLAPSPVRRLGTDATWVTNPCLDSLLPAAVANRSVPLGSRRSSPERFRGIIQRELLDRTRGVGNCCEMRERFAIAVGLIALAAGCGAASAIASPAHPDPRTGTVTGRVVFDGRQDTGVVKVSSANGRLVAHHDVRWGHGQFQFVLMPGRYEITLRFNGDLYGCPQKRAVRVRANRTVRAGSWAEACPGGSY
jgi:hypothetical protein